MEFIKPKNWADFQHYKDRSPTWIKLHKSILDNYDYQRLPLASKALAPMLWLLASEYDEGKIPLDYDLIAFRLRVDIDDLKNALSPLIHSGFFVCNQDASKPLADCLPREEDIKHIKQEDKKLTSLADANDPCPQKSIIELYQTTLPMMPAVREWTPARAAKLRNRWKEKPERQTLGWWAEYFRYVAQSDFLCGRSTKPFTCNLEWLITPANFAKVIEGNYENRGVTA